MTNCECRRSNDAAGGRLFLRRCKQFDKKGEVLQIGIAVAVVIGAGTGRRYRGRTVAGKAILERGHIAQVDCGIGVEIAEGFAYTDVKAMGDRFLRAKVVPFATAAKRVESANRMATAGPFTPPGEEPAYAAVAGLRANNGWFAYIANRDGQIGASGGPDGFAARGRTVADEVAAKGVAATAGTVRRAAIAHTGTSTGAERTTKSLCEIDAIAVPSDRATIVVGEADVVAAREVIAARRAVGGAAAFRAGAAASLQVGRGVSGG